ncbi:hypothetical protein HK105_207561, partial [Polyrhizophydium stewartii]
MALRPADPVFWGDALAQLLQTRPDLLASAHRSPLSVLRPGPNVRRLDAVAAHIRADPSGFDDVHRLVQDKVQLVRFTSPSILVADPPEIQTAACIVLHALVLRPDVADAVSSGLQARMRSASKPARLAVAIFLEHMLAQMPPASPPAPDTPQPELALLDRLVPDLLLCIESDGTIDGTTGRPTKTRLTSLAADVVLAHLHGTASRHLATTTAPETAATLVSDATPLHSAALQLVELLKLIAKFNTDNPMRAPCIDQLIEIIGIGASRQPESNEMLAATIRVVCKSLVTRDTMPDAKIVKALKKTLDKERDLLVQMLNTCGVLAVLPLARATAIATHPTLQPLLLSLISDAAHQPESSQLQTLAFVLLRRVLAPLASSSAQDGSAASKAAPLQLSTILDPLLGLLKSASVSPAAKEKESTVLHGIAGVVAELAVANPSAVLSGVFELLSNDSANVKRNGLAVVGHIIEIHRTAIETSLHAQMSRVLGAKLLECLADADMELRKQAVFVFSHLEPAEVIPPLVARLISRSERERSAAESALVALLSTHRSGSDALILFIEHLR